MTLTVEAVKDLRKQFKDAKIKAMIADGDPNEELMIHINDSETVVIDPGRVDIKVFVDADHRQLIMWADEQERTFTQKAKLYCSTWRRMKKANREAYLRRFMVGEGFPIGLPEGTTYEIEGTPQPGEGGEVNYIVATVKASVPASQQTFLIGTDEDSQFVCGLPSRVKTVKQAHKILRPDHVPAKAPRQGEWFFVPATVEERQKLEVEIAERPALLESTWLGAANDLTMRYYNSHDTYHEASDDTSHVAFTALVLRYKIGRGRTWHRNLFVRGYIIDDRTPEGRNSRHKPLWLNEWHRVVRNLEVQVPGQDTETWD